MDNNPGVEFLLEISRKLGIAHQNARNLDDLKPQPGPRTEVFTTGKARVYQYSTTSGDAVHTPLLIVYALVNRPHMLDLEPDRSLIANLVQHGIPVYLLDWGYPDLTDRYMDLKDYLFDTLNNCVDAVCSLNNCKQLNLLGVCQGGTFSLCYTAARPNKVNKLITTVTPVDFQTDDNLLSRWFRDIDIDALVSTGNVPGNLLNWVFLALKPFKLGASKYVGMLDKADDPASLQTFLRMEQWIQDSPDQAGVAFGQFIRWFFQENRLIEDSLKIGDEVIRLEDITHPLLNIYASQDHLVPPSASQALHSRTSSPDYSELEINAGHIGLFTSKRHCHEVADAINQWLLPMEKV